MNENKLTEPAICKCSTYQIENYGCQCGAWIISSGRKNPTNNGTFYAIYNKEQNKFLSVYEDGEGTEYYSVIELSEFSDISNPLFKSKEDAEYKLKEAINMAGFSARMNAIPFVKEFLMDAKIVTIEISIKE